MSENSPAHPTDQGDPTLSEPERAHTDHPTLASEAVEQVMKFAEAAKQTADAVNKRAGRDLFIATLVAVAILALVGACLIWVPWGFAVLVAIVIPGAQIEVGRALAKSRGARIVYVPLLVGSAAFLLAAYGVYAYPDRLPAQVLVGILTVTVLATLLIRLTGPIEGYLADVGHTLFLLAYPCLIASALVFMSAQSHGSLRVAIFILGIAGSDTGGYFLGMLIGKHPMSPRISPKKSWEGVVGSFLLSGIVIVVMVVLLMSESWYQGWWKGLILAVVLVTSAILGDLVESVIKRDLGIKDMGTLLPGHGGLMDRIDSYVVAAVPVWLTMSWLFPNV